MTTLLANQAIDLAIAGVISAFAVLVGAVAGYIQLRGQSIRQAVQLQAVKEQVQQGSGGATTVVAVPSPVGAGVRPALAAPIWNQLNDPLPDAQQDPYATTDCGEEATAMAIAACGGPQLPAGVLRQLLGGPQRPGVTDAAALVYLLNLFKIPAHPRQCDPDTAWIEWSHAFDAGKLVIALGYWVSAGYLHWVLIRQTGPQALTFNDPWGGTEKEMDKATALKLYQGSYVHIDQAVSESAPAPPAF